MISRTLFLLTMFCNGIVYAMNNDGPEITPAESRNNKIEFIDDTFTSADAWEYTLSQPSTKFACTPAKTTYAVPHLAIPSMQIAHKLIDYSIDNKISFAIPSLLFEEGNVTCIACEDTSLHLLKNSAEGELEHHYIAPCHNKRISGIAPLSNNWLAIAGGASITCCNLQDQTRNKRITFKEIPSITGITNYKDMLIIEAHDGSQHKLYPYNPQLYKLLHGKDLDDYQIEVVFQAALALHMEKEFSLEPDAQNIYNELPTQLLTFINAMLRTQNNTE